MPIDSQQQPKILHVLSCDLWGGREAQVAMLLSALRNRGVNVELLAFKRGEVSDAFAARSIPLHVCPESEGLWSLSRSFLRFVRDFHPQLIVSHGYKEHVLAAIARVRYGIPFIAMYHGASEFSSGLSGARSSLYFELGRKLVQGLARRIICVSSDLLIRLGFRDRKNATVIYNMIDAVGQEEPPPAELFHPAIVCVGRLVPVKRFDLALQAAEQLKRQTGASAHWYFVGSGPEEQTLRDLARKLGLSESVHFVGFVPQARSYIRAADVFLMSSDHEGIPTVLLEALSAQRKIVSSAVGGIPEVLEIFEEYPYLLFPRGDVAACAEMVSTLLAVPPIAVDQRHAEVLAQKFSPDVIASIHQQLYGDVIR